MSSPADRKSLEWMFRCQICKELAPPHTPAHRIVLESRPKKYPFRLGAHPSYKIETEERKDCHGRFVLVVIRKRKKTSDGRTDDPGGEGHEIVRELTVCAHCAKHAANR